MVLRSLRRFSRHVSSTGDSPEPRLLKLGLRIRQLREEQDLSLEELAHRSDLSFRGLIYIEHGRRNAGVPTLLKIADGLGISPADLFGPGWSKGAVNGSASEPG
ncbi:helix-turn-helix domain-containing protein [Catenulispora pinisilvae]|uniref:helix-turn-helix domain-containing protein n=1 Tax=Catenulispora pinisilvae TaxID=2705253 RepID=UPI001E438D19|nr:helix-turn-helix transcriptional regulator [Catenulispora pinisilvae]